MNHSIFTRAALAVAVAGLASPIFAQETTQPFLTFEHEGLSSFFVDDLDLGLLGALSMLPSRVGELPSEIDDMPPEVAGLIQLFLNTIAKPARVALLYDGENPTGGFFGYGFLASVECANEGEVEELRETILAIVGMIAEEQGVDIPLEESERFEGMSEMMLPFGLLSFGPRHADTGWRYEIVIGTINDSDAVFSAVPKLIDVPGFESFVSASVDFSALTPAARIITNMAGNDVPQLGEITDGLEEMGLLGEDALRVDYQAGATPHMSVQRYVIRDAARRAEALSLPTEPLTMGELNAIPADAFGVTIGKASFDSIEHALDQMVEQGLPVNDALDEFEDMTGVDLIEDVFQVLGGTFAFYNSDSTGGGSLLSAVAMMTVDDQEAFSGAMHKLSGFANDLLEDEAEEVSKYIYLDSWSDSSGADLITLRFPGVPVPLELTFAFTEDWFIAGLTPQAAVAAARQTLGEGDEGLTANPRFAAMFREHGKGATSIAFVDTPRTIRGGYPFLTLIGSGLSNLVRSPNDHGQRDPGMILPLYNDLVADAAPTMKITRWRNDDLVTTAFADRSLWVQAGGSMGVASIAVPLVAAGVGAAAIASGEINLGFGDLSEQPMVIVHAARRSFSVDPVADFVAAVTAVTSAGGFDEFITTEPRSLR